MRSISNAIASSSMKRFVHRNLQGKGNPGTAPPSFSLRFPLLGTSFFCSRHDFREKLRNGLRDIKLDDAIGLFSEMVKSRPLPSIVDFSNC
ncbi:unnamed protein product [Microthlaspi erraticum]|uniref:Pentatricopeptide repeat-containing protein n=1 Tax=Microthlaspi erraticum TaxID=1685480 RepID=A0A6D2KHD1_9BRAS|nr:unnamed protein product [Microthlaspi erraticum]